MRTATRIVFGAAFSAVLLLGWPKASSTPDPSRAASVLFQEFETVFYSRTTLLSRSRTPRNLSDQQRSTLGLPFAYLLGALDSEAEGLSENVLSNSTVALVGAKDFRPPTGLGGVNSRFCYILLLRSGSMFDLREFFHQPPESSPEILMWSWSAKLGEFGEGDPRPSTLYATQIEKSYVLLSNDPDEIKTAGKRLTSDTSFQELGRIRDWTSLNKHDVWGYRRYSHAEISKTTAAGMTDITPTAEALAFFFDSRKETGVLRLFASDSTTPDKIAAAARLPQLRPVGSGVWETRIPLLDDEAGAERMTAVMWMFGFGVYL